MLIIFTVTIYGVVRPNDIAVLYWSADPHMKLSTNINSR